MAIDLSRTGSRRIVEDRERWEQADHALAAKRTGPHGLARYAELAGRPASTLRRWARVAEQFPASERQLGVSFSAHEAVASRSDRFQLLRLAAREAWSLGRVRSEADLRGRADHAGPAPALGARKIIEFGPATLDNALAYCQRLASVGGAGRARMTVVEGRVKALAELATSLAEGWEV